MSHAAATRPRTSTVENRARRQPLLFEITTAGYDRHSICFEHQDYAIKLLEGTLQDDSWFAYIALADEQDDWTDPQVWRKANPSFGLPVKQDDLARKAENTIALPAPRTPSGACTSMSGPSRRSAGSSWPAALRRSRSLGHNRHHGPCLGVPA